MKNKFSLILSKITALVLNYPLVLLMSLATVIVIVYGIETNPNNIDEYLLLRHIT